jgi:hypothetical protein
MHYHKYGRRKQCIKKLTTNENSNRTLLPGTSGSRKEVIPNTLLLAGCVLLHDGWGSVALVTLISTLTGIFDYGAAGSGQFGCGWELGGD